MDDPIKQIDNVLDGYDVDYKAKELIRGHLEEISTEIERLQKWNHVQVLTGTGPKELPHAIYPQEGKPVVVWVVSDYTKSLVVHTIAPHPHRWSWPSFGVAWRYIDPPEVV